MKLNSKTLFALFFCVTSCFLEEEECENHYYQKPSEEEMQLIPYRKKDSIVFKDNLGEKYFFSVIDDNICNPCSTFIDDQYCKNGGYYSFRYSVSVNLNSNIPVFEKDSLTIDLLMNGNTDFSYLFKPEGLTIPNSYIGKEYNGKIFVRHNYKIYIDSNKLEFYSNNNFFVKPDPQVLFFQSYYLDEREFKNTYAIIESKEFSFFDTIVYAPKYGFIKFTDDTLTYSYIEKYER